MKTHYLNLISAITVFTLFSTKSLAITPPVIFNSPTTSSMNACPGQLFTIYTELALCNGCSGTNTNNSSDYYVYQLLSYPSLTVLDISTGNNNGTYYFGRTEASPGTYKYVVKAYNNKDQTATTSTSQVVTVKVENASISPAPAVNVCSGNPISVTLTANSSGNPQYYYQWKLNGNNITGATNSTYVATVAGSYTVQVINNGTYNPNSVPHYQSCYSTSNPTVISVTSTPSTVSISTANAQICQGDTTLLQSTVEPVGSYNYQWKLNGNNISGATGSTYQASAAGNYSVTINPNTNCSAISNEISIIELAVPPTPTISAASATTFCDGGSVTINTSNQSGISYQWIKNSNDIPSAISTSYTANTSGNYQIRYTLNSNGCYKLSNSINVVRTVVPPPNFTYGLPQNSVRVDTSYNPDLIIFCGYCSNTEYAGVSATQNYSSYSWGQWGTSGSFSPFTLPVNNTYHIDLSCNTGLNNNTLVLKAGYNGCYNYYEVKREVPPYYLPVGLTLNQGNSCQQGGAIVYPTATYTWGNLDTINYNWQLFKDGQPYPATFWNPSALFINETGNYVLKISAKNEKCISGSVSSNTFSYPPFPPPTITTSGLTSFCQGSSVVLTANTGTGLTYQWKNNGTNITGSTSASYTATTAGSYSVAVTNSNGCSVNSTTTTVTVNQQTSPTFTQVADICSGGTLNALPTTSNNSIAGSWSPALDNTTTTTYTFTPTSTASPTCATNATMTITVNPTTPTFTQVAAICSGESLNALPTTSNNSIVGTWSPTLDNTATTTYTFTPTSTSAPMCATNATMTIMVNSLPSATISTGGETTLCQGSSVVLNANTGAGLTYQWLNNGTTISGASTASYSATASGSFTVAVTNSNNCSATSTATNITVNPLTSPTFNQVAAICLGELLNALPTTSNNSIAGSWSPALDNTTTTTYSFTPTSTASPTCATDAAMTITVNSLPNSIISEGGATTFCEGGSIALNANTGSGLIYQWSNDGTTISGATAASYNATTAGSYSVAVTNSNNCSSISTPITITVNTIPSINAGNDQAVCAGTPVTLSATGADTYVWNNGVSNANAFVPVATNLYMVTGTNLTTGCSNTDQVLVTVNNLPSVNAGNDQTVCAGTSVTLTATGADSYAWNNGVSNANAFVPTATNLYTVTGTNLTTGCTNTDQVIVTVNNLPNVTLSPFASICDTAGAVTLSGGSPAGGVYSGSSVNNNSFNTSIGSGNYVITYTYTDNNSCSNSATQSLMVIVCSGAGLDDATMNNGIYMYPNPTLKMVTIVSDENFTGEKFALFDPTGRLISNGELYGNTNKIDVSMLSTGTYYLKLSSTDKMFKIVKE